MDIDSYILGKKSAGGGGGGSSLPAVTSEDNGDVLTVVNGAWDKAAPSGGGSLTDIADAVITCTVDGNSSPYVVTAYELLKGTFADVYGKATNGQPVLVVGRVSIDFGGGMGVTLHGVFLVTYDNSVPDELMVGMGEVFLLWDANGITAM